MRMRYPINRQRGGSIFTMIIFVMMLISTALMYYYFQRSRTLERDLYALKNGEPIPSESGEGLLSFMGWNGSESDNVTDAATQPQTQENPAADAESLTMSANATQVDPSAAANQPTGIAPASGVVANRLETHAPASSESITHESLAPAEQFSTRDASIAGESEAISESNENAPEDDATGEETQDSARSDSTESEGQSLYNMAPPTVRVRAPQR